MVLRRVGLFCNIVRMVLGSRLVVVLLGFVCVLGFRFQG